MATKITPTASVNLLGVEIDEKLNFDKYFSNLFLKGSRQINAICRLQSCMNQTGKGKIMNSFLYSNFNYDSLLWYFRKTK